jgi:hypothetical protein
MVINMPSLPPPTNFVMPFVFEMELNVLFIVISVIPKVDAPIRLENVSPT